MSFNNLSSAHPALECTLKQEKNSGSNKLTPFRLLIARYNHFVLTGSENDGIEGWFFIDRYHTPDLNDCPTERDSREFFISYMFIELIDF